MVHSPAPLLQLHRHAPISIGRHLQRHCLQRRTQTHGRGSSCLHGSLAMSIVASSAHARRTTQLGHAQAALPFFGDLGVHRSAPFALLAARPSSSLSKALFKKSFSNVSRPIVRSNSASRLAGFTCRIWLKALAGSFSHANRQRCNIDGSTWQARATSATLLPASSSRTAATLNSLLMILRRDLLTVPPPYSHCFTVCLTFGVHSSLSLVTCRLSLMAYCVLISSRPPPPPLSPRSLATLPRSHVLPRAPSLPDVDRMRSRLLGRVRRRHSVRISRDRKSTRLNSSHVEISYAVFCLKKKTSINI